MYYGTLVEQILMEMTGKDTKVWTINPTVSVNNISFGSDRKTVRSKLGTPIKEFDKSKQSKNTTDDYGEFHIFYDSDDKLEAVEVFNGTVNIWNKTIFPGTVGDLLQVDNSFNEKEEGYFISTKLQMGVYAPTGTIKSVLIGRKDYY